MGNPAAAHTAELFLRLTAGEIDEFLEGCADDVVLEVRGFSAEPVSVGRQDIPSWFAVLRSIGGSGVESDLVALSANEERSTVVLRHHFERNGVRHGFDMVHVCVFDGALLQWWSVSPLDAEQFAGALRAARVAPAPV